jgi:hypothetical protein
MVNDAHERVSAGACLALAEAAAPPPPKAWSDAAARAIDPTWSIAEHACAAAVARHIEREPSARSLVDAWFDKLEAQPSGLTAGHVRALLAAGKPEPARWALAAALRDASLRRTLLGVEGSDRASTHANALPRAGSAVALSGWLARVEMVTPTHLPQAARDAARLVLDSEPAPILADLATPGGLLSRLTEVEGVSPIDARAALLDQLSPSLTRILERGPSEKPVPEATRRLLVELLAERPSGLDTIIRVAQEAAQPTDRRLSWDALASPRAHVLDDEEATRLIPLLKASLAAPMWRERLAALACIGRHPLLARALASDRARLRGDPDPFVADAARTPIAAGPAHPDAAKPSAPF